MRRLRTRCESCGEVALRASDIVVAGPAGPGQVNWSFRCPVCGVDVEQCCDTETARLLLMSGARPAPPEPPPLDLADLESLRELLERPDFVTLMGEAR
jgi:hypothetical protein